MSEAFEVKREEHGDILVLQLIGNITEDSHLDPVKENLLSKVVVDLENVNRINSYGIRQWINLMKEINENCELLVFHRCPPPFVEQFNMISNFGGGGVVYSCYLPFYNEEEDKELVKLYCLPGGVSPDSPPDLESLLNADESGKVEFNDIEDEYFVFLQHQKGKTVPKEIVEVLS